MKLAIAILGALLLPALHAQTAHQTRCSAGTYVTCSYALYDGLGQVGHASQDFNRANPISEYNAFVQGNYKPQFTVSDIYTSTLNYIPANIKWSSASNTVILEYDTPSGIHAKIVFDFLTQRYGCGRSSCLGTFWTVMDGTEFGQ